MARLLRFALFVVFASGLCGVAHAEWIVVLYTGTSHTRRSDLRIVQPDSDSDATFENVHWKARPFEDSPYYGLRLSYFPAASPALGAAFDFTHYKMYAETDRLVAGSGRWNGLPFEGAAPLATRVQALEISHGVNLSALNVQYRWSDALATRGQQRGWLPHIGAGVVGYWPHAEGTIDGISVEADYRHAGSGAQIFGGGEYRVSRRIGVLLEGKFDAGSLDIELVPRTRLKTHTRTAHAIAGVALHF